MTTLYLAPIRGFTDTIYRNTFSEHFSGIDLAMAPFISTVCNFRIKPKHVRDLLPEQNRNLPVIPQILTNDADGFIRLACYLYELGYGTVNWNLGCPYPMVAKKKRGSGLLPFPDRIDEFLEKVLKAIPNKLSVKTRLGRFSADEIFELMPVFNRYPLEELIIHPRTGVQMYEGVPDFDLFESCLEMSTRPVVYNGDIFSTDDFTRLKSRFKTIDKWMIGRGVLVDPFLPETIAGTGLNTKPDRVAIIRRFHDDLFERYAEILSGPSHLVQKMKGTWGYLSRSFTNSRKFLKKIYKTKKLPQYQMVVDEFFSGDPQWE